MRPVRFLTALLGAVALALLAGAPARAQEIMLPVPTTTLYPGDTIEPSHIVERRFRYGARSPILAIESRAAIVGKVARRTLLPGQPIPHNAVDDPKVVRRGVPTQVIFREKGLVITGIVEPMQSASVNEIVRARNPDSGLMITGIVQPDGSIRVGAE